MPEDFLIARNPDPDSTLPYLIRVPLPGRPIVLKARETWPRTSKVYCHRAEEWPATVEVIERVPTRPAAVADGIAELQVRWPSVPIVFTETRPLAEEWTYRWLAAALAVMQDEAGAAERLAGLVVAPPAFRQDVMPG